MFILSWNSFQEVEMFSVISLSFSLVPLISMGESLDPSFNFQE